MTVAAIAEVMGGRKTLKRKVGSSEELILLVRDGLPVAVFAALAKELAVDRVQLARVVGMSTRTMSRRLSQHGKMSATESDRTVRLARLLAHAKDTFGDMTKASRWLQIPNLALGGKKPFELLDTDAGVQSVDTILGRIDYGLFS